MKKVFVLGVGAQGSTVAQRLDEHPGVAEIVCADYDQNAVDGLVKTLRKARGVRVDGSKTQEIIAAARGADILVNALPVEFGKQALDAALAVKANYQDFAAPSNILDGSFDDLEIYLDGFRVLYGEYGKRFAKIGKTAIVGTGSAPGLICVAARRAVRELDSCDTINMLVYDGGEAKRFLPFWWSPVVALGDMAENGVAFIDGKLTLTEGFSLPVSRKFPEMGGKEVTMVEHMHDEPIYMGINADTHFKGARNIYFKYGGVGIDFARPLARAGLLSREAVEIGGQMVVPFDVILHHLPPAPKYREEIREILDEGLVADEGALVVEAYGQKDRKDVMVDVHIFAPGVVESFERSGLTAEMYQTGQCGYLFTKMLIEGEFHQRGVISTDMLDDGQVDRYLGLAAEIDITLSVELKDDSH
ncbi:MAG: saccharopine dehydrogenase NADP-binding domain-containing protein [Oscillospiraceae bacterium]|nr:saccharopine dehydrogenase NADP-binding domain-containing protein [Oscillospiraceae bacterium]